MRFPDSGASGKDKQEGRCQKTLGERPKLLDEEPGMRLKDKFAIVTGAGRGIGKAIALALAGEGCNLALVSRTRKQVQTVADLERLADFRRRVRG